ncbi:recombinase family protein [Butyrivibrio sp. M55]|uniref:recombinase family protein n=1 Tax=Butyrivibrio sp. M55 TaxID=1855323 RepID=UPI0008DEE637|nr:recombinase family protein [Butyrivibrio sp. M55]SFU81845.1 site-specific DNA recombinase [Butyrivibrio sp. M55]
MTKTNTSMMTKVYLYTRVSTAVQVDGYSLDAQKAKMKAFCEYNDYEIVGEYEDAGISGKSIENRIAFNQMMDDIKNGKDNVSYVLVFKLSRFGRNAADTLSALQTMQDFDVNLICVEDGIDSSKDAGKLMISVLSAVAEIERENIRVQTMEGRMQKAREGKWNGGFAPYGYKLVDGALVVNEEEADAIRTIYDLNVNQGMGAAGIARYLENHGIVKMPRQNGKTPLFSASLIKRIIKNPVYCGKIAYGRRRIEKVRGTRNDYHLVNKDDYILVDGKHEPLISEELWEQAQIIRNGNAEKYKRYNRVEDETIHLLSGIVKCPICGAGMYANKCTKRKKDGTFYKHFYYYGCKHRRSDRGHRCDYKRQINEELLDAAVIEAITQLVQDDRSAKFMKSKIDSKVDVSDMDAEIEAYGKQLRQCNSKRDIIISDIDSLDVDDKHYKRRKTDLENSLYRLYDHIEELEDLIMDARAKRKAAISEKMSTENIYKTIVYIDRFWDKMDSQERRDFIEQIISEVNIFEERTSEGQWLKSIKFNLPLIAEDISIGLDKENHVETVCLLTKSS